MIILLNGTSSVGKSTIAHEIHMISKEPFLHFCMDNFFSMLHPRYDGLGPKHLEKRDSEGKLGFFTTDHEDGYRINSGKLGKKLSNAIPKVIKILATSGLNLVVPVVIDTMELLNLYREKLQGLDYILVYIDCDKSEIQRREKARGDRLRGTSLDLLNQMETKNEYDFKIDSTNTNSNQLAKKILEKVNLN